MPSPKHELLELLGEIDGLTSEPSKVAGGVALFYRGQELGHFHSDTEVDLRLTKKVIKELGLTHPPRSTRHPKRGASSQWIEMRFHDSDDVRRIADVLRAAIAKL